MCGQYNTIVAVFVAVLTVSSYCHDFGTHEHNTFEVLTKVLDESKGKPSVTFKNVETLFSKLHFENCTGSSSNTDCWKCFTVSDLYQHFNLTTDSVLNETSFIRVSPAIVYHLLPEKNSGSSGRAACNGSLPDNLFAAFSENKTEITLGALDKHLENVNESLGQFLTKKKCFSARSVLHAVKSVKENDHGHEEDHKSHNTHDHDHEEDHKSHDTQSLDKDGFERACAIIVFHLAQGYCIEEDHGELPPKTFFLDNLFGNTTHFPEAKLLQVTKKLGIGVGVPSASASKEHSDHSHDDHRHRRSVDNKNSGVTFHRISRRAADEHDHSSNISYEGKCYSVDDMLKIFDVDHSVGATKSQLKDLCPALLQQFISGSCTTKKSTTSSHTDKSKVWGYGFAAVTIISVLSLIGVSTVPFVGKKLYKKVLALLVALAVGSLAGDALLHLLPHGFGLHQHSEESGTDSHGHGHEHSKVPDFIWKALTVIASIYCFYLLETLMHFAMAKKTGKHAHSHVDIEIPGPSSRHMSFKERNCPMVEHHSGIPSIPTENGKAAHENGIVLTNMHWEDCTSSPTPFYDHSCDHKLDESSCSQSSVGELQSEEWNGTPTPKATNDKTRLSQKKRPSLKSSLSRRSVFSQEEGFKPNKKGGVSSYAWMIIIGDTIHNISDGLAIGAAFSEAGASGISGGISTSIAVFCHELPHELGDFAVLLSAGMSVKMALLANFLSACSCYVGLVIGIQIGQMTDVRLWIFAIAGGMFLYVALVDMLPDLMHSESLHTDALITFILQNAGLLLGFGIMLIIAVYEEDLRNTKF